MVDLNDSSSTLFDVINLTLYGYIKTAEQRTVIQ